MHIKMLFVVSFLFTTPDCTTVHIAYHNTPIMKFKNVLIIIEITARVVLLLGWEELN